MRGTNMNKVQIILVICLSILPDVTLAQRNSDSRFSGRSGSKSRSNLSNKFKDDYYDYDQLPQGPTRPSNSFSSDSLYDDYFYYDDAPLPSGPTREPPLPSGPTRRPGQPTRLPPAPSIVGVPRNVYDRLPLLTTRAPPTATPRPNVNFRIAPPRNRNSEPLFELPRRAGGDSQRGSNRSRGRPGSQGLFVTSDLDILDQTKLFSSMDPNQEQFIRAPRLNAGALPLAFEAPDSNNSPFFPPLPPIIDGP